MLAAQHSRFWYLSHLRAAKAQMDLRSLARAYTSHKQKFVHEVLVNHLFKLAQEKVWLG